MSTNNGYRIAVVHNKIMPYRLPFFRRLSKRHDVDYLIFDEDKPLADSLNVISVGKLGVFRHLRRNEYDIVLAPDIIFKESWASVVAAWLEGIPVILWSETWDWPNRNLYQRLKTAGLFRVLDRGIDGYVVPGSKSKEYILQQTATDSMDIRRVPNASHVNQNDHSSGLTKTDIGIPESDDVILFLGELTERKGVHTLLRASAILEQKRNNFTLLVCGTGDEGYIERLKSLSTDLGLESAIFYGWVDNEELYDIYSLSDVYTLLSTYDPFPLSVIEAMGAGTPPVVSDGVGQSHDLVRDGETGFVVRNKNPSDAAAAIGEILENDEKRRQMGQNSQKYIRSQHTYDEMLFKLDQEIDHVLYKS